MKSFFVIIVFIVSTHVFAQPVALAETCQGSGCRYVCREELKRCGSKKKACRRQYQRCLNDCPK